MEKLTYIFCHGLSGWGEYDKAYKRVPYWGVMTGDMISDFRAQGYDVHAASVSPQGSA